MIDYKNRAKHKAAIIKLFKTGRTLYFSDIADELDLDLREVVSICDELSQEQRIWVV